MPSTISAAAVSASRRTCMGVPPEWSARPSTRSRRRVLPATASTSPIAFPSLSRSRPCSICSSRNAASSFGAQRTLGSWRGSRSSACSACPSVTPSASRNRCKSPGWSWPTTAFEPRQASPNRAPSSPTKAMTLSGCWSSRPALVSSRTTSRPATTPTTPSNRPPCGTESRCDPMPRAGRSARWPGRVPMVLPKASTATVSPRSAIQPATTRCASRSSAVRARRLTAPSPSPAISLKRWSMFASRAGSGSCSSVAGGDAARDACASDAASTD